MKTKALIRRLRALPMTVREIAEELGRTEGTVRNWARGAVRPHPSHVRALRELASRKGVA